MLFLAFLLELACCEDHVCCSAFSTESTLAFGKQIGFNVFEEVVKENSREDLIGF